MTFNTLIIGLMSVLVAVGATGGPSQSTPTYRAADAAAAREEASPVAGKWEGTARNTGDGDIAFTMELKSESGKISGTVDAPQGIMSGKDGTFADGTLSITFAMPDGTPLKVVGKLDGEWLRGEWELGQNERGAFECKKIGKDAK